MTPGTPAADGGGNTLTTRKPAGTGNSPARSRRVTVAVCPTPSVVLARVVEAAQPTKPVSPAMTKARHTALGTTLPSDDGRAT